MPDLAPTSQEPVARVIRVFISSTFRDMVEEREPWLREHLKHSVTELEILHGVLNNPDMTEHAFFYFRDPAYLKRLPPGSRE